MVFPDGLPQIIIDVLKKEGIKDLYPPQRKALPYILAGKNLLVSIPTASGKTLIAEIAMINFLLGRSKRGRKIVLYLCPLKALASQKYSEFGERWGPLGFKIGMSTGDPDLPNFSVFDNDIVIMTNEKADSMLRMRPEYIKRIGMVIVDEIHLLGSGSRGCTLEILLMRLKRKKGIIIMGLSATVSNAEEIASWLDAETVISDWRPVELREGYYIRPYLYYADKTSRRISYNTSNSVYNLAMDTLDRGGKVLVFVNTRKSASDLAEMLAAKIISRFDPETKEKLARVAEEYKKMITSGGSGFAAEHRIQYSCLARGTAYHHAGLTADERKFIELNFNRGNIFILCATPTLAAGVNTPARTVIIKSLYRYDSVKGGMVPIPVMEYKQMAGRAGRPGYDPYGEAVIIVRKPSEDLVDTYIYGKPEDVVSGLDGRNAREIHILGEIVTNPGSTLDDLVGFMKHSLYAHQLKNGRILSYNRGDIGGEPDELELLLSDLELPDTRRKGEIYGGFVRASELLSDTFEEFDSEDGAEGENDGNGLWAGDGKGEIIGIIEELTTDAIGNLVNYGFVEEENGCYFPTEDGRVIFEMYLDPSVGAELRRRIDLIHRLYIRRSGNKVPALTLLYLVCLSNPEMGASIYSRKKEIGMLKNLALAEYDKLKFFTYQYDPYESQSITDNLSELKRAFILNDWINEIPDTVIMERYDVGGGDIRALVETAGWMMRAVARLAKVADYTSIKKEAEILEQRIKHGVKEELVPLVKLKGIGRVRARILYNNGIPDPATLKKTDPDVIRKLELFSDGIIKILEEQLGGFIPSVTDNEIDKDNGKTQKSGKSRKNMKKTSNLKRKKSPNKKQRSLDDIMGTG